MYFEAAHHGTLRAAFPVPLKKVPILVPWVLFDTWQSLAQLKEIWPATSPTSYILKCRPVIFQGEIYYYSGFGTHTL